MMTNQRADNDDADAVLFREGGNCWKVSRAERFGWCVDGENYFSAVSDSLDKARRELLIVDWDIDSRFELIHDKDHPGYPSQLCDVLQQLVDATDDLCVRVLSWDFAVVYMLGAKKGPFCFKLIAH